MMAPPSTPRCRWSASPAPARLPDLRDRLELRKNRSLYSRIERRLSIGPTVPDDTGQQHEEAGSSLREIDRMATAALREAARRKKKLVEREVMAHMVGDLGTDGS
ncbi:MAG TPA: hypothetical protein VL242_45565 [Sorangium sp.]|nr:hypothetical protein [Sorangium sp.]